MDKVRLLLGNDVQALLKVQQSGLEHCSKPLKLQKMSIGIQIH